MSRFVSIAVDELFVSWPISGNPNFVARYALGFGSICHCYLLYCKDRGAVVVSEVETV